jgi:tetratricopeptide (TPR) repeat protein
MERTTWGRINELFETARRLPAGEREAWVRAATTDEYVQSEVLSLLHAHEDDPWSVDEAGSGKTPARVTPAEERPKQPTPAPSGGPSSPAAPGRQTPSSSWPPRLTRAAELKAGGQFATYRLIREMSRSTSRVVFEAAATGSGTRPRVALHVLASDSRDPAFSALLRAEGNILAHLDHRGIPRLLDGGVAEDGRPYLAFEFAAGDPIDVWCRERNLTVRERVGQVLVVCDAVEHAHQHLVAHGDLRPSNILVSADADIKLLDCGMRALLGSGPAAVAAAGPAHAYMSPEQVRGEVLTTASDVYALGVLLYTLLTGYPPYELSGQTPARARHMISELEPDVPSTVADGRDRRVLKGTLDRIVLKALRKNPRERYVTAAAFAADLRAWRDGRPASVAPATSWPRVTAAGSGRALRIGAAGLAVALLAGVAVLGRQVYLLRGDRDQARLSVADGYRRLADLQANAAGADPASRASAIASLDTAIAAGEQALAADPGSLPALIALTGAYGDLVGIRLGQGDADAAGKADARLRALVGQLARNHPREVPARAAAASGYTRLGEYRDAGGDTASAKVMYGEAIAAFESLGTERHLAGAGRADLARAHRRLGAIALQEGDIDAAERLLLAAQSFDTAAAAERPVSGVARREMADAANLLAMVARRRGDAAKAEGLWTQALTALQASADADPGDWRALDSLAAVQASLGSLCRSQRRFEESLAHYRDALRVRGREAGIIDAPPSAPASLAVARTDVARLLLDLVELRLPGPADAARLREAGALLAEADQPLRNATAASPAPQGAVAELDRQAERLGRLSSRRR